MARDACLTVGLPVGAAECGDLRLAHALPSVRTLNQQRTPVLIYNSEHASPNPVVAAHVTLPGGTSGLSRVVATLKVNGTPRGQGVWRGSAWPAGTQPVRIAVGYDAARDATGPYRYTLEVKACYGTTCTATSAAGQLAVVNRRDSPFGAGWWLAGVERLVLDPFGKPALWVGGDGSTRRYTAARGDSVWGAPTLDQPDTLKREGNGWVRLLSGGGRVRFDAAGHHIATRNRLGHTTEFWYGAEGRIDSIGVPPAVTRDDAIVYTTPQRLIRPYAFVYGSDGLLSRVDAPGAGTEQRRTHVHHTGARVDSIIDPDDTRVRFGYTSAASLRVGSYTDRRKYRTDFAYDAGHRVASAKLWMDSLANGDSIVTGLRAAESVGLALADGTGAIPLGEAYARIDGPRTDEVDVSRFWLDRRGAPLRIMNALGDTTEITRGDPRFPALVTKMRSPNGRVVSAAYDARGNVVASTDSSRSRTEADGTVRYATTRYQWDPRWDVVTKVTLPEGEVTTFGYDSATGNRIWQQVGSDIARRVSFRFQSSGTAQGMISASTAPGAQMSDSVAYDRLGNLALVVSPKGSRVQYVRDAIGRDSVTLVPLEGALVQRQEVSYLAGTDLVERTSTTGPAMNGAPEQTLWARSEYDADGNVTAVERWSSPDLSATPIGTIRTVWRYDAAGRVVAEIAPGSGTFTHTRYERVCEGTTFDDCVDVPHDSTYTVEYRDSTLYDPAGNPVEVHTRRRNPATGAPLVIRMKYDALGRLKERVVPQVHYDHARNQGIPLHYRSASTPNCTGELLDRTYPGRPNDGACGYRIDEDVQTFGYDVMGNLTRADNRDAQVRRRYNTDGTLQLDSLRIRTTAGADFSLHQYGLEFSYDLNGRRTQLNHPAQLAPSGAQSSVAYGYDPATGELTHITDPLGNVFYYLYNTRGELQRRVFAGAGWDEYAYDEDGALTEQSTHQLQEQRTGEDFRRTTLLRNTQLTRDAQGRLKHASNAIGLRDTVTSKYSGLGHLVSAAVVLYGDTAATTPTFRGTETFTYDALAHSFSGSSSQKVKREETTTDTNLEHSSDYAPGTDRLSWTDRESDVVTIPNNVRRSSTRRDRFVYDLGGNLEFSTNAYASNGSCSTESKANADCEDRASFYAADGSLRAAEHRVRLGDDDTNYWRVAFEEYRYDALGRRVWVRSQTECPMGTPSLGFAAPCYSAVRRTVWDGDAELWEIQMPGKDGSPHMENDTASIPVQEYTSFIPTGTQPIGGWDASKYSRFDPNPRYGRVAYTHGLGVDQPLSVVRIGLMRYYQAPLLGGASQAQSASFAPFAAMPLTDWRGHVDGALYAGGTRQHCETFSGTQRCTSMVPGQAWSAYGQEDPSMLEWHGTLLTGKQDATGTLYRRARYYDPQTGRFTQEDPSGLVGGINLYGYAGGDPINYFDPSGNFPVPVVTGVLGAVAGAVIGTGAYLIATPRDQWSLGGGLSWAGGGALIGGGLGVGAGYIAPAASAAAIRGLGLGRFIPRKTVVTIGKARSSDFGELIGWGKGQTAEAVAKTQQATQSLTRESVRELVRRGLTREWVEGQLGKYLGSAAQQGAKLKNTQLFARTEMMKKLLELWP